MRYERRRKIVDNIYAVEHVAPEAVSEMQFHKRINDMADKALKEINGAVTEAKVRLKVHRGPILKGTVPNDVFARLNTQMEQNYYMRQMAAQQNIYNQLGALGGLGQAQQPSRYSPYSLFGGAFCGLFG